MCSALYKTPTLDPFPAHPATSSLSSHTFKKSWLGRTPVNSTYKQNVYIQNDKRGKMRFVVVYGGGGTDGEERVQSSLKENSLFHTSSG